jgi:DNA-binding MarR family transcriptional regulator
MRELLTTGVGHQQIHRASSEAGVSPGLLKMSMLLSRDEPLAMRELARRFSVDASYITSVVDGLEQAGIAERRPHPSDRRIKTVVLTERGADVLARVEAVIGRPPPSFDVLSPEEQVQLRDLLGRVLEATRAETAPAEPAQAETADA